MLRIAHYKEQLAHQWTEPILANRIAVVLSDAALRNDPGRTQQSPIMANRWLALLEHLTHRGDVHFALTQKSH